MELNTVTDANTPGPLTRHRRRGPGGWIALVLVIVAFVAAYLFGVVPREHALEALGKETRALAVPTVAVTTPTPGDAVADLVLPGNLQAYTETPVYARATGYLKRWTVDMGTRVKAGDLLAEIEIPEIDAEVQQARADAETARVTWEQAKTTSDRWQELVRSGTVTRQDADSALNAMRARKAALDAARENVTRLDRVRSFRRVVAPFDGVITTRNADTGELIDAGAGGAPGRELFRLAATKRLRVRVNVPQSSAKDALPGTKAELTLPEYPGRRFAGKLVRTAQSIDASSRTLLAEIEVDNADGELLPGAYAQVHLKLPAPTKALVVPINTLLFRAEGPQAAVVGENQKVVLKSVTIGRDFGTKVELLSGLDAADRIILNPSDSITDGVQVRVVAPPDAKK
ncbi:MAG: efflux RND transporter periplasmic adaptor subunit [Betaproteobacteria bacterium]|nr:efflux RND transporter periplasmic adaptor subunit [Betaproteobacteria bacterium]